MRNPLLLLQRALLHDVHGVLEARIYDTRLFVVAKIVIVLGLHIIVLLLRTFPEGVGSDEQRAALVLINDGCVYSPRVDVGLTFKNMLEVLSR